MRLAFVIMIALTTMASEAGALDMRKWMTDSDLDATFRGRTIDGVYSNQTTFTEQYLANGRLKYQEPSRRMEGRWSVIEGTFCTIYDAVPTGGCYRVHQMSENCFEFYYAATDEEEAANEPSDHPSWTARAWTTDRPSTCRAIPSV